MLAKTLPTPIADGWFLGGPARVGVFYENTSVLHTKHKKSLSHKETSAGIHKNKKHHEKTFVYQISSQNDNTTSQRKQVTNKRG